MDFDFDFKWWIVGMIILSVVGFGYEAFKDYNRTQVEIAKAKCESK